MVKKILVLTMSCILLLTSCQIKIAGEEDLRISKRLSQASALVKQSQFSDAIDMYVEILGENPFCEEAYIQASNIFTELDDKESALGVLKKGIMNLGGSNDARSSELLNHWWNMMVQMPDEECEPFDQTDIQRVRSIAYLIEMTDCFYFADELTSMKNFIDPIEYYCYRYMANQTEHTIYTERYPVYSVQDHEMIVLPSSTVEQFVADIFQVQMGEIVQRYKKEAQEYDAEGYQNYQEYLIGEYPAYAELSERSDLYCYFVQDIETGYYEVRTYQYLGNETYYVVFEGGWHMGGEEEAYSQDMLHLIVKRNSETPWGFCVISKLKDYGKNDANLIRDEWESLEGISISFNGKYDK